MAHFSGIGAGAFAEGFLNALQTVEGLNDRKAQRQVERDREAGEQAYRNAMLGIERDREADEKTRLKQQHEEFLAGLAVRQSEDKERTEIASERAAALEESDDAKALERFTALILGHDLRDKQTGQYLDPRAFMVFRAAVRAARSGVKPPAGGPAPAAGGSGQVIVPAVPGRAGTGRLPDRGANGRVPAPGGRQAAPAPRGAAPGTGGQRGPGVPPAAGQGPGVAGPGVDGGNPLAGAYSGIEARKAESARHVDALRDAQAERAARVTPGSRIPAGVKKGIAAVKEQQMGFDARWGALQDVMRKAGINPSANPAQAGAALTARGALVKAVIGEVNQRLPEWDRSLGSSSVVIRRAEFGATKPAQAVKAAEAAEAAGSTAKEIRGDVDRLDTMMKAAGEQLAAYRAVADAKTGLPNPGLVPSTRDAGARSRWQAQQGLFANKQAEATANIRVISFELVRLSKVREGLVKRLDAANALAQGRYTEQTRDGRDKKGDGTPSRVRAAVPAGGLPGLQQ